MSARKSSEVFLKAIHIQGFKSFADKIKLDLQSGMSVIVGPNGSGKSNIADAVRWVLGEQSAKSLRGSKMEDVIFAGSSSRKQVGMAEVSLLFDNSTGLFPLDYQEVVITRRVYRDGEGHYFINKTPCRLKDIQELFMDTGSGKEGFSIIGQGRVEEILNLKADERRLLIEEVAGISKFRLRKKEAVKKMEDTQQNVNRLEDIIVEVEARIEPLANQAEIARVSKDLINDLEKAEISLIVNELSEVNNKLNKSQNTMVEQTTELTVLTTRITEEENLNIRGKYELNLIEERVQELQGKVYALENNVQEAKHEISLLTERHGFVKEQFSRLEKELRDTEEKLTLTKEKLQILGDKEINLQDTLQTAFQELQQSETRLNELRELSGGVSLEELKAEIYEQMAQKSKLISERAELEHKKVTLLKQEGQLGQDVQTKEEEKNLLHKEIEHLELERQRIEKREAELCKETEETKEEIIRKKSLKQNAEEACGILLRKMDQSGARRNALQTLEDNLEGYQKGVREAIFACRKGDVACNTFGTVAENIEVEPKYELAVETALGSTLQNIIVEKTEDGKNCIAYLKKTNNGRATFLPLDAIKGGRQDPDGRTKSHQGFEGLAVDLVKYDRRYNDVMESLLGRIIVADTMDSAIEIAKMNNYRVRVVTLLGDQVNLGGSLTGGSTRSQSSGLLGRAREIEELTSKIKELDSELEKKKMESSLVQKKLDELFTVKENLDTELKALSESKGIMAVDRKHREDRIIRLNEDVRMLEYELKEVTGQLSGFGAIEEETGKILKETDHRVSELQAEQAKLEKLIKETTVQAQELAEEITAAKVEAARWEQELNQTKKMIGEEKTQLQINENLLEEKKNEIKDLQKGEEELLSGQNEMEIRVEELNVQLDEKRFELVELRKEKEDASANTMKQEKDIQMMRSRAKDSEQQIHQGEVRVARWQAEWESGSARLQEEFNLGWEEASAFRTEEKRESLQEKIVIYKQQIEELGPVNYTALEEYPETLKRFDFLVTQRDDLVEAGKSLLDLISELDKSMIERFQEGFCAVNEAFQEVFKQLFNGGYAELQLDDPDNLLETGVKIVAQPPGKKAQLLSLLSGGERSFTAIALLFAFLKVKPSPFCLLDEIEAALDEANVKRFVQYLQRLSGTIQFILISHRRGTMESADRLYGVTMEESGVSKLLSVQLEDKPDGTDTFLSSAI